MKTTPLTIVLSFITAFDLFAQGSLTPPTGPAPTMKSLDQVASTGIAINSTNTAGDPNSEFIIAAAGSYFLTGNLAVTKTNGIRVTAANVTVDLNGFQISRASGSGGTGITVSAKRCTIENGSIAASFENGIDGFGNGVDGTVRDVSVSGCNTTGIRVTYGWLVERCTAVDNGTGISIDSGGVVRNCRARTNTNRGISGGNGSTIIDCVASGNGTSGIGTGELSKLTNCAAAYNLANGIETGMWSALKDCSAGQNTGTAGIIVGHGSTLTGCNSSSNFTLGFPPTDTTGMGIKAEDDCSIIHCLATSNEGDGIRVGHRGLIVDSNSSSNGQAGSNVGSGIIAGLRATVKNCSASENRRHGISVGGESLLMENHASHNGRGGSSFGIDTTSQGGTSSRVEANQVRDTNGAGFNFGMNDIVVRNHSGSNTLNFSITTGANFGPIQTPNSATNPLANISF